MLNQNQVQNKSAKSDKNSSGPIAISSSDGKVHSDESSFGRRLDMLRKNTQSKGSCTHAGWDS